MKDIIPCMSFQSRANMGLSHIYYREIMYSKWDKIKFGSENCHKKPWKSQRSCRLFKEYAQFQTIPTSPNMVILRPMPSCFRPYTVQD